MTPTKAQIEEALTLVGKPLTPSFSAGWTDEQEDEWTREVLRLALDVIDEDSKVRQARLSSEGRENAAFRNELLRLGYRDQTPEMVRELVDDLRKARQATGAIRSEDLCSALRRVIRERSAEAEKLRDAYSDLRLERNKLVRESYGFRDDINDLRKSNEDLTARIAELEPDAKLGAAVRGVLGDFGWDHAVVRERVESDDYAESVVGCILLAIERVLREEADNA